MDHGDTVQMMAVERYLLDELTPEERDAFEKHLFDCSECALDLRVAAAFVTEAKTQLSQMDQSAGSVAEPKPAARTPKKKWSFLWQPAFAVPAFAAMLAVIAWQNVSTIPSLRRGATEPRILHSNAIHAGTRGSAHTAVMADPTGGLALTIALPQSSNYSSYSFELQGPNGKKVWSQSLPANAAGAEDGAVSLVIPGAGLVQGPYSLTIFGVTPPSDRVEIDRRVLDVQFDN